MSEARVLSDAPWLRSGPAARVLALLNGDGEEARVVGGAVRNALLKIPLGDIDIATTALPDEVVRRAKAAGIKCVPTGIDHGTVTLVVEAQPFEVTTLREDTETFGRKAKVAFGRDWVRDAERRDFTINGLSVDAGGIVHDHVGGLADIEARRVRFIGDASQRIAEDYLRILRFFRMHAAYGAGEPDRAGYLACIDGRAGLASLSAERVRMEMLKLLVAEGAAVAVQAMADAGLLLPIFGGVAYTGAFAAMIAVERALALPPNAVRRLAALTVAVTEDAKRVSARLRLSNAEAKALDSMGHRWWRLAGKDERAGAAASLSARRGSLPRPADAGMGAGRRHRQWRCALARARNLAAALERAEISAEGGRFHLPRHCRRARARPRADACGRRLAGRGFSAGCIRACRDRRPDRRPFHPRSPAVNILAGFADISAGQLVLVGGVALFASIVGGLAGYGTGALMPLVLVPLIGAEPVVPIIAISAIITNISRFVAYFRYADRRRALIVIAAAALTTALGAYGYTRLTGAGAALVIGSMLILSVPLRRLARKRDVRIGDTGLGVSAVGLWRAGRRHIGLRRDPAVAVDGVGSRRRGGDRHRRRDLGRDRPHQDFGVRPGRRRHRAGAGLCAADRRHRDPRRVPRQRPSSSACRCISTPRSSTPP